MVDLHVAEAIMGLRPNPCITTLMEAQGFLSKPQAPHGVAKFFLLLLQGHQCQGAEHVLQEKALPGLGNLRKA